MDGHCRFVFGIALAAGGPPFPPLLARRFGDSGRVRCQGQSLNRSLKAEAPPADLVSSMILAQGSLAVQYVTRTCTTKASAKASRRGNKAPVAPCGQCREHILWPLHKKLPSTPRYLRREDQGVEQASGPSVVVPLLCHEMTGGLDEELVDATRHGKPPLSRSIIEHLMMKPISVPEPNGSK